jgi:hypothetical protein
MAFVFGIEWLGLNIAGCQSEENLHIIPRDDHCAMQKIWIQSRKLLIDDDTTIPLFDSMVQFQESNCQIGEFTMPTKPLQNNRKYWTHIVRDNAIGFIMISSISSLSIPMEDPREWVPNTLHVHLWGQPWINNRHIIQLTTQQHSMLCKACIELDMSIIQTREFTPIVMFIDQYIAQVGPIFFRLSSVSPKDVKCPPVATSAQEVFDMIIHSIRCQRELKSADHFSLVFAPFDPRIALEGEFRVFIVHNTIHAIANCARKEVTEVQRQRIDQYVQSRAKYFPYHSLALDIAISLLPSNEIIFIEFNPLDDELDTFGAFNNNDDAELRELLCQPSKRGKESTAC